MSDESQDTDALGLPTEPQHECSNCGEKRHNLLGGEGIHKCSTIVKKDDLRELVKKWRDKRRTEELQEAHIEVAEMCNELEAILDE